MELLSVHVLVNIKHKACSTVNILLNKEMNFFDYVYFEFLYLFQTCCKNCNFLKRVAHIMVISTSMFHLLKEILMCFSSEILGIK